MCARCDNGWAEYRANGQYLTGGFCDCPDGHALEKEMGQMWAELELEDYPIDEEGELHKDGNRTWFDAQMERYDDYEDMHEHRFDIADI